METFSNAKLDWADLPSLEDFDFVQLESDYLYMRISGRMLFFLALAGIGALFSLFAKLYFLYWMGPLAFLVLYTLVIEILGFKRRGYCLREQDISYRRGLLFHSVVTIPLSRVQHCEYNQGPLGRLFDLATVKIFTAGGQASDLSIKGLTKEQALALRDEITRRSSEQD